MVSYEKWKEFELLVTNLLLDPKNPRIPSSETILSQDDLIADLVENDKVYDLARSIVDNGYYPVESIIIVEENRKKYVLEGNRRVAALKLLIDPEKAPDDYVRRFRALSNRLGQNNIKKIKAVRAPSRDAAYPIIRSKHTQKQVEHWNPVMQAKSYKNLVDSGLTIDDIHQQYNVPPSEITDALQRYTMYSIACILEFPEDVAKKVQNPRDFPITTLDRLYKNPKVNDFLGVNFDENKQLQGSIAAGEFKKGYSKIVSDIATNKVGSRSLNRTEDMDNYLASFGEQKPDLKKKGEFTADSLLRSAAAKSETIAKAKVSKKKAKKKPKPSALIPSSITCDVNNQRINDVFNELRKLKVAQYPNAVGIMFRCLLEMSLGYYLDKTGHLTKLVDNERREKLQKGQKLPDDWHPTLLYMLKYVVNKENNIINSGNILRALKKLITEKDALISVDSLNLFVHNQYIYPNEDTLRRFWMQLERLFQIILVEPDVENLK